MPIPVVTVDEMRQWETRCWNAGASVDEVIANVGRAVAEKVITLTRRGDRILILAGKGNNGADARATAGLLLHRNCSLLEIVDPALSAEKVRDALSTKPDWIIDGLFGIGLNRDLDSSWQEIIALINASNSRVVSIDCPSGLDADTGRPRGAAIQATTTLTIGAVKHGLLRAGADGFVGRLELLTDVGLDPALLNSASDLQWIDANDFAHFPPARSLNSHKGSFGHVAIVAGSIGYHGAGILAVRGALRAQPGLVTIFCDGRCYVPVASQLQAAMVHPLGDTLKFPAKTSAVLFGPGLASPDFPSTIRNHLVEVWRTFDQPVIVDASSLSWISAVVPETRALRIITPHPGEAAQMLGRSVAAVQNDRVAALRSLSEQLGGAWVVLKGQHTLIGQRSGPISVNSSGSPSLAQGGTGDLLAGYIAGLMAQPAVGSNISHALEYAVWQHGASADHLSAIRRNWGVDELAGMLGAVAPHH